MPDVPYSVKPQGDRPKRSRLNPPSVGDLKRQGVTGVRLHCSAYNCGHHDVVSFEKIGAPDEMPFPSLPGAARRFVCSRCGGHQIEKMPDWPVRAGGIPATYGGRSSV